MCGAIGPTEILIVVGIIVIFFFGARKLPQIARSLGQSITFFKKGYKGEDEGKPEQVEKKEDKKDQA